MSKTQVRPLHQRVPARDRAALVRQEIIEALDDGRFEFVFGYLKKLRAEDPDMGVACKYGGCALAALAFCFTPIDVPLTQDERARERGRLVEASADTGIVSEDEARSLEAGYEGFPMGKSYNRTSRTFYKLGQELRREATRRGVHHLRAGEPVHEV